MENHYKCFKRYFHEKINKTGKILLNKRNLTLRLLIPLFHQFITHSNKTKKILSLLLENSQSIIDELLPSA